jgi:hypothetical protein
VSGGPARRTGLRGGPRLGAAGAQLRLREALADGQVAAGVLLRLRETRAEKQAAAAGGSALARSSASVRWGRAHLMTGGMK